MLSPGHGNATPPPVQSPKTPLAMDSRVRASRDSYHLATDSSRYCRLEGRQRYPAYNPSGSSRLRHEAPKIHYSSAAIPRHARQEEVVPVSPRAASRHVGPGDGGLEYVKGTSSLKQPTDYRYQERLSHPEEMPRRYEPHDAAILMMAYPIEHRQSRKTETPREDTTPASSSEDSGRRQVQYHGSRRTRYEARRTTSPIQQPISQEKPLPRIGQSATSADHRQMPHRPGKQLYGDDADCHQPAHAPASSGVSPSTTRIKKRVRVESPSTKRH